MPAFAGMTTSRVAQTALFDFCERGKRAAAAGVLCLPAQAGRGFPGPQGYELQ